MYTRWRDRGGFATSTISSTWKQGPSATTTFSSSTLYPYTTGTLEQIEDTPSKDFKKRSGRGDILNTPMHQLFESRSARASQYRALRVRGAQPVPGGEYVDIFYSGSNINSDFSHDVLPSIDITSLLTAAATACRAKIQAPDVQGFVFLAELRQSLKTLRDPLEGARKALKAIEQKNARGFFKSAADQHLAIVFGLMPFYNDLVKGLKAIRSTEKPFRYTARGIASGSASLGSTQSLVSWWPTVPQKPVNTVIDRNVTVRAYSLYEVSLDLGVSGKLGFSPMEITSAYWELIPYSFVLDRFVDVGKLLDAIKPKIGVTILTEGYTILSETNYSRTCTNYTVVDGNMDGSGGGDYRGLSRREKTRIPGSLGPNVGLTFYPKVDVGFATSMISLITQKLTKLR